MIVYAMYMVRMQQLASYQVMMTSSGELGSNLHITSNTRLGLKQMSEAIPL